LLIGNLGYSALVGMGVLLLALPVQFYLVRVIFKQRKKGVDITDRRVRLSNEVCIPRTPRFSVLRRGCRCCKACG
jgi:ATP-binding cassette subfamily C (CFTR/MRP) protein 1